MLLPHISLTLSYLTLMHYSEILCGLVRYINLCSKGKNLCKLFY